MMLSDANYNILAHPLLVFAPSIKEKQKCLVRSKSLLGTRLGATMMSTAEVGGI